MAIIKLQDPQPVPENTVHSVDVLRPSTGMYSLVFYAGPGGTHTTLDLTPRIYDLLKAAIRERDQKDGIQFPGGVALRAQAVQS